MCVSGAEGGGGGGGEGHRQNLNSAPLLCCQSLLYSNHSALGGRWLLAKSKFFKSSTIKSTQKFFSSKTLPWIIWCQPNANPRSSLLLLPNSQQPPTPSTQVSISLQRRSKDCWRVSSLSCQITPSGLAAPLISSEAGQIISAPTKLNPYPAAATDCTALRITASTASTVYHGGQDWLELASALWV